MVPCPPQESQTCLTPICNWLIVPVVASDKVIGLVELGRARNDNFDLESSHVLPALIRKFHEAKGLGVAPPEKLTKRALDGLIAHRKPDFSYLYGLYLRYHLLVAHLLDHEGMKHVTAGANPIGIQRGISKAVAAAAREHRIGRPLRWELVNFIVGKAAFVSLAFVVPMLFHPVWVVLFYYLVAAWVLGTVMVLVFVTPRMPTTSGNASKAGGFAGGLNSHGRSPILMGSRLRAEGRRGPSSLRLGRF